MIRSGGRKWGEPRTFTSPSASTSATAPLHWPACSPMHTPTHTRQGYRDDMHSLQLGNDTMAVSEWDDRAARVRRRFSSRPSYALNWHNTTRRARRVGDLRGSLDGAASAGRWPRIAAAADRAAEHSR